MVKKRNEGKNIKLKQKPNYGPVKNKHTFKGSNHSMNPGLVIYDKCLQLL
uniref:Uncharacterized protein n=1 Tax=Heterorhabditis bacteriophora TaxID=37862 RepID=A0A1I7XQ02_HETBA